VKKKNGEKACPFNYLYWDFLLRNRAAFHKNHRMGVIMKSLDRMGEDKIDAIRRDSRRFLDQLN